MSIAAILKRFVAAVVSLALLLSAPAAIAATMGGGCDDQMAAMAGMAGMDASNQNGMAASHKMPCNKSPGICAAICADMASVGVIVSQMNLTMPTLAGKTTWQNLPMAVGISRRPDLPPPISII